MPPSDHHFQNSIVRFKGRLVMAERVGWRGGEIWISELDEQHNIRTARRLEIPTAKHNSYGNEDPRLFVIGGRLHCEVMVIEQLPGGRLKSRVAVGRLRDDLTIDSFNVMCYSQAREWEKNWAFFEHDGRMLAVYTVAPHRIVEVNGCSAKLIHETQWQPPLALGDLRGGASPVLFRGEFYHFAHGVFMHGKRRTYCVAAYTFEAEPPFRPSRVCHLPILLPDEADRWAAHHPSVVFPCGAALEGWEWVVSGGDQDKWGFVAGWDFNQLESHLEPVAGSRMASLAVGGANTPAYDRSIWLSVNRGNEYEIPDSLEGETVVDVGAHIGSFTKLCLDRGVAKAIACELRPDNIAALLHNCEGDWSRLEVVPGIIDGDDERLPSNINGLSVFGSEHDRCDDVPRTKLSDVLRRAGKVRLLKIDCEGAEYEILGGTDLSSVEEIVGEAHTLQWEGRDWSIDDLGKILRSQGYESKWRLTGEHAGGYKTWYFRANR